jgi:hypothetical protein
MATVTPGHLLTSDPAAQAGLRRRWGWVLALGMALIVVGGLACAFALTATLEHFQVHSVVVQASRLLIYRRQAERLHHNEFENALATGKIVLAPSKRPGHRHLVLLPLMPEKLTGQRTAIVVMEFLRDATPATWRGL